MNKRGEYYKRVNIKTECGVHPRCLRGSAKYLSHKVLLRDDHTWSTAIRYDSAKFERKGTGKLRTGMNRCRIFRAWWVILASRFDPHDLPARSAHFLFRRPIIGPYWCVFQLKFYLHMTHEFYHSCRMELQTLCFLLMTKASLRLTMIPLGFVISLYRMRMWVLSIRLISVRKLFRHSAEESRRTRSASTPWIPDRLINTLFRRKR